MRYVSCISLLSFLVFILICRATWCSASCGQFPKISKRKSDVSIVEVDVIILLSSLTVFGNKNEDKVEHLS